MDKMPDFLEKAESLVVRNNQAYWDLATTGRKWAKKRFIRTKTALDELFGRKEVREDFLRRQESSDNAVEKRKWDVLARIALSKQGDPALLEEERRLSAELEYLFDTFLPKVGGKYVSFNEISHILRTSLNSSLRQEAWEASKEIGMVVANFLRKLGQVRNQRARSLGFASYYELMLEIQEISPDFLSGFLSKMEQGTRGIFEEYHEKIQQDLRKKFRIKEVKPWHYSDPFFQEPPATAEFSLDNFFQETDIPEVTRQTYLGMGIEIRDLLSNSDLYERKGKNPHGFCLDVDRKGDVRVLCNIRNDARWMKTMLHEFGHAVYAFHHEKKLPFWLRTPAHIFTTEAIALFMDRLVLSPFWLEKFPRIPSPYVHRLSRYAVQHLKERLLVFTRWVLVMCEFERKFYENPEGDLNRVWWECVRRFQGVEMPEGREKKEDWACKIHLSLAPVYYHNYLLGEAWATQLEKRISPEDKVSPSVGDFLIHHIFTPGAILPWNDFIMQVLSEPLNPQPLLDFLAS
ncbi:MAG: M2 family metallopeptidase [bacterium JZ-2024 1]